MKNNDLSRSARIFLGLAAISVLTSFLLLMPAQAQAPKIITYQGRLKESTYPVSGVKNIEFKIFNVAGGGAALYTQGPSLVLIDNGLFSVELGPIPDALFDGTDRYLEIKVELDTLSPREHITSSAFSLRAGTAAVVADSSVTSSKLTFGAVTSAKLADLSVTSSKLVDGSVTTAKLADLSVTSAKLADLSVTSAKLADGVVTSAKLLDGAVTTTKLAEASVTTTKLAPEAAWVFLGGGKLGAVTASLDVPGLANRRFLQIRVYTPGKSNANRSILNFNGDGGANYSNSGCGSTDGICVEGAGSTNPIFSVLEVVNLTAQQKLTTLQGVEQLGPPVFFAGGGRWNNAANPINRVTLLISGGGNFPIDTELQVFGRN